jgi:hypothetical protein
MCAYVNEIAKMVDEFVNDEKLFTAFDVTMALRKRSKSRIQHYEVKGEVHKMFSNGGMFSYNRTLANLPNVNPQPWVYHPVSADVSLYNGKPLDTKVSVSPPAPTPALAAPVSSMTAVDDDDGTDIGGDGSVVYKFDTTDRLCVPNKLVRQLGLKDSDPVTVSLLTTNEVVLTPGLPAGATHIADYHVDRYDNVRIGRATFTKAGISAVAFEIDGDNSKITVKKYA